MSADMAKPYKKAYQPRNFNNTVFRNFPAKILSSGIKNAVSNNEPHKNRAMTRIYLPFVQPHAEAPPTIKSVLADHGFEVLDYIKGTATKTTDTDKKRVFSIGKILNRLIEKNRNTSDLEKYTSLKKSFDLDPRRRASVRPKMIVISRDPVDIAGMSYDRSWKSCMNLTDERNLYTYVLQDVKHGSLIAYFTDVDDVNIEDPAARILIKPYIDNETQANILMVPEKTIYGNAPPLFRKIVQQWCDENYNKGKLMGLYCLNRNLYVDSHRTVINRFEEYYQTHSAYSIASAINETGDYSSLLPLLPKEDKEKYNSVIEHLLTMDSSQNVLAYIENPTEKMIWIAIKNHLYSVLTQWQGYMSPLMLAYAVMKWWGAMQYIETENQTHTLKTLSVGTWPDQIQNYEDDDFLVNVANQKDPDYQKYRILKNKTLQKLKQTLARLGLSPEKYLTLLY